METNDDDDFGYVDDDILLDDADDPDNDPVTVEAKDASSSGGGGAGTGAAAMKPRTGLAGGESSGVGLGGAAARIIKGVAAGSGGVVKHESEIYDRGGGGGGDVGQDVMLDDDDDDLLETVVPEFRDYEIRIHPVADEVEWEYIVASFDSEKNSFYNQIGLSNATASGSGIAGGLMSIGRGGSDVKPVTANYNNGALERRESSRFLQPPQLPANVQWRMFRQGEDFKCKRIAGRDADFKQKEKEKTYLGRKRMERAKLNQNIPVPTRVRKKWLIDVKKPKAEIKKDEQLMEHDIMDDDDDDDDDDGDDDEHGRIKNKDSVRVSYVGTFKGEHSANYAFLVLNDEDSVVDVYLLDKYSWYTFRQQTDSYVEFSLEEAENKMRNYEKIGHKRIKELAQRQLEAEEKQNNILGVNTTKRESKLEPRRIAVSSSGGGGGDGGRVVGSSPVGDPSDGGGQDDEEDPEPEEENEDQEHPDYEHEFDDDDVQMDDVPKDEDEYNERKQGAADSPSGKARPAVDPGSPEQWGGGSDYEDDDDTYGDDKKKEMKRFLEREGIGYDQQERKPEIGAVAPPAKKKYPVGSPSASPPLSPRMSPDLTPGKSPASSGDEGSSHPHNSNKRAMQRNFSNESLQAKKIKLESHILSSSSGGSSFSLKSFLPNDTSESLQESYLISMLMAAEKNDVSVTMKELLTAFDSWLRIPEQKPVIVAMIKKLALTKEIPPGSKKYVVKLRDQYRSS